jgi:predicted amidohydrolase
MEGILKVAVCQMKNTEMKVHNIEEACRMIRDSAQKGIDIAVLPEIFNSPYDNSKFRENAEKSNCGETVDKISELAKELGIYIIAGSIPEMENEKIYNTSYTFNRQGEIIGRYRKIHLFDINIPDKIMFKESDTISPGEELTIIETEFGKVGVIICYDIRFPELVRLMVLQGAKFIFVPAAFNLTTGPVHWELLMRARAVDNQVFLIAASPARNTEASYVAYGHSMVIDPWGTVISRASEKEEIIFADLELSQIETIRNNLPILKHRRTDLYELRKIK